MAAVTIDQVVRRSAIAFEFMPFKMYTSPELTIDPGTTPIPLTILLSPSLPVSNSNPK